MLMPEDILKIMETLPHRYPFLMLDRVLELTSDSIVGLKNVTINEPFFQGHFPGEPIMPGVMIIEAMAQTGGVLGLSLLQHLKGDSLYFMGMDKVRFRKPVRPGDQLLIKVQLMKQKGTIFKIKAEAFVEEQLVAEAELLATIGLPRKTPDDLE
jgi:beta-hydroxyacyl-ACP dehydratase FabZ